ncbi:MAG TPA: hypothetical protein DCS42_04595 [Nitrospiraceae bacterium]|nr:hypothetical protein [Nitrospiraceae bacterium]
MLEKIKTYTPWVITVIALASALYGYYHPKPSPQGQKEFVAAEVPKEYKAAPRTKVKTQECLVTVITKTEIVIQEKWPDWFKLDDNLQLTAIGIVKPYKGETECASIINLQTGDSRIVTRQLPVPLLGFENTFYVGGLYGVNGGFMVNAGWNFARVGSFYPSVGLAYVQNGDKSAAVAGVGGTFILSK